MRRIQASAQPKTFIDLFAGIGGFHHALEGLGLECVWACELDEECRTVYRTTWPEFSEDNPVESLRQLVADIRAITLKPDGTPMPEAEIRRRVPDHDVLCAGFPCQPFSKSGAQMGVRDQTRGTLFFDIMQIARAKQPRFMILENVRNLAGPRHDDTWRTIIESIRDAGYRVAHDPVVISPHLIPKKMGGAPQVRDRVFILCEFVGRGKPRGLVSPPLIDRKALSEAWNPDMWSVAQFLQPDAKIKDVARYRITASERVWLEAWEAFVAELPADDLPGFPIWADALRATPVIPRAAPAWKRAFLQKNAQFYRAHESFLKDWLKRKWGPQGQTVLEFPPSRFKFEWQARKAHPTRRGRTLRDLVLQLRPSGIRVKPATYLPALVAITQTSIVGPDAARGMEEFRRLTPAEAARLQGIPGHVFLKAGMPDRAAYKQLGNAVNVGVVRLAAKTLIASARPDHV